MVAAFPCSCRAKHQLTPSLAATLHRGYAYNGVDPTTIVLTSNLVQTGAI